MPAKKKVKLPEVKQRRIVRPDAEQLALLEKAIFHSYKLTFLPVESSNIYFENERVSTHVDLKDFFNLIVKTYSTL